MTWLRDDLVQQWRCPCIARVGGDLDQAEDDNHMTHRDGVQIWSFSTYMLSVVVIRGGTWAVLC
jgi:hypothetical protein